ncbi:MAG: hypothetical protein Q7S22_00815 [Candidatus Micrarchaeota archaeon]|nr:hypothetical protein [Candidatus Micrarchaeota archaeon]
MQYAMQLEKEPLHYPNLKTVLMVEEVLKNEQLPIKREALKQKLVKKVQHQTLNVILSYLEDSGKIIDGHKGIVWVYNPSPKLKRAIEHGMKL